MSHVTITEITDDGVKYVTGDSGQSTLLWTDISRVTLRTTPFPRSERFVTGLAATIIFGLVGVVVGYFGLRASTWQIQPKGSPRAEESVRPILLAGGYSHGRPSDVQVWKSHLSPGLRCR